MNYGIDYLGGATFQSTLLSNHRDGWGAGFFAETFGNAWGVVEKLAKTGKAPYIRVHALWDDLHSYGTQAQILKVKEHCRKICKLAQTYKSVKFYFSPFCEHNLSAKKMNEVFDLCRRIIANHKVEVKLVNCVWKGEKVTAKDVINEIHGTHAKVGAKYIYSFDGLDCYNADTQKIKDTYKEAELFFFWTVSMNLKRKDSEKISVKERIARSYRPKGVNIQAMYALKENKGVTNVPKIITIKPMSEDCGDRKSNKLLILTKTKYDSIELIRNNKQQTSIEVCKRFDPPSSDLYRYYASKAGFEYVKKNLIAIKAGGKILKYENKDILFCPSFRDGTYRN